MEVYILVAIICVVLLSCISSSVAGYFASVGVSDSTTTNTNTNTNTDTDTNSTNTSKVKSNIVYCNDAFNVCETDSDNRDGIELKEHVIYTLKEEDTKADNGEILKKGGTVFYMDLNMIRTLTTKKYTNLQDFLNDINKYQKEHKQCINFYKATKELKTTLSFTCSFFSTISQLLSVIQKTLLLGLDDDLLEEYLSILEEKALSKSMTTFEYFTYYAIISKFNNKNVLILIK